MSLRKENTQTCYNGRLAISSTEQLAFSRTIVELSEQDLARVTGGDGPSGMRALRPGNRPGFPVRPGVSGGPGRCSFPAGPGFPRDWCGGDGPGLFDPDPGDGLGPWGLC
jgi:hypothetical protein